MEISAIEACKITEIARKPVNPWNKLFDGIRKAAEKGHSTLTFDEESEGVRFAEHRKEVKKKLEKLGYVVSYSRLMDKDCYFDEAYHNCYVVSWEGKM